MPLLSLMRIGGYRTREYIDAAFDAGADDYLIMSERSFSKSISCFLCSGLIEVSDESKRKLIVISNQ